MKTYFSNNRWIFWTIGILVLLNLFTLSMLWFNQKDHPRGKRPSKEWRMDRDRLDDFMAIRLQLTDEQREQMKGLQQSHRQKAKVQFKKLKDLKQQRMEALTKANPDTTLVQDLARQIGQQQTRLEELLSEHYYQLRAVCTEEQQEELGKIFRGMMERRERKGRGGPGKRGRELK